MRNEVERKATLKSNLYSDILYRDRADIIPYFVCSLYGMDTIRVVYEAPLFVFQACVYVHTSWTLQRESREKRLSLSPRQTSRGSTLCHTAQGGGSPYSRRKKRPTSYFYIRAAVCGFFYSPSFRSESGVRRGGVGSPARCLKRHRS